jgi:hypothetical protein
VVNLEEGISPGLTFTPSTGHFRELQPGTADCDSGTVNGEQPTGPGTYFESGTYRNSTCVGGMGDGTYKLVIPTAKGLQTLAGRFSFDYPSPPTHGGLIGGHIKGEGFHGDLDIVTVHGDCVATPATGGHVIYEFDFDPPS